MTTPVVLDVDTGVDDALALLLAARSPVLDLLAVTCVVGNALVDQVVHNTLVVLDAAGADDVPVGQGAERPLRAPVRKARLAHGRDGMADLCPPAPSRTASDLPGVELLRRTLETATSPVTVVALAPRTNIAQLLRTHPEVAERIERIVVTGGAVVVDDGNAAAMDFNVWHDPDAAEIVLSSGVPMTAYGLDVFYDVTVDAMTAEAMAVSTDPVARLAGLLIGHQVRRMGRDAATIGDAGAVAAVIAPNLLTIARRRFSPADTEVDVAVAVDADRARDLFLSVITAGD